jgi:hypothetical protein
MRIAKINRASSGLTDSHSSAPEKEVVSDVAGRALVVVGSPPTADEKPSPVFREAAFLAQLIATKDHHPQTRERRRAEPSDAIEAYRAVSSMTEFD